MGKQFQIKITLIHFTKFESSKLDFYENLQLSQLVLELLKVSRINNVQINQIQNAQNMDAYDDLMINIQIENWDVTCYRLLPFNVS